VVSAVDHPAGAPISPAPARLLVGLGGLYVAQSVIGGVVFTGLPAVMRQNGASLNDIAFILLTVLPWSFKFLWAPWIERFRAPRVGPRRSRTVIALIGACAVGAVIACALIGPTALGPLMVAMMIASFSSATVDIACDGHAVESLAEKNYGWSNSAQVGGAYLGAAIGGGLFLVLIDHLGWTPSTLIMAGVLVALALPFLTTPDGAQSSRPDAPRQSLIAALKRPEILSGIALISLYVLGQKWSSVLVGPFLIDAGFSLSAIGLLNGVGVTVSGLIGAVSGGYVVRRFGAFPVMAASMAAQVLATAGFALYAYLGARSPLALVLLGLLSSGAISLGIVAVYSELMGRASLDQAGVDFTLFQSMDGIVSLIGWRLVSLFGDTLGFAACFAACAALGIVALATLPLLARHASAFAGQADQRA
jgi:MFS transporter (putative signal transducer)